MPEIATITRQMLRTRDAARYLGIAESTAEKLRLTGGGPRFIKLGKSVCYDPGDLDAWLEANKRRSTTDRG
jgi:excisionase family DNA binding protein